MKKTLSIPKVIVDLSKECELAHAKKQMPWAVEKRDGIVVVKFESQEIKGADKILALAKTCQDPVLVKLLYDHLDAKEIYGLLQSAAKRPSNFDDISNFNILLHFIKERVWSGEIKLSEEIVAGEGSILNQLSQSTILLRGDFTDKKMQLHHNNLINFINIVFCEPHFDKERTKEILKREIKESIKSLYTKKMIQITDVVGLTKGIDNTVSSLVTDCTDITLDFRFPQLLKDGATLPESAQVVVLGCGFSPKKSGGHYSPIVSELAYSVPPTSQIQVVDMDARVEGETLVREKRFYKQHPLKNYLTDGKSIPKFRGSALPTERITSRQEDMVAFFENVLKDPSLHETADRVILTNVLEHVYPEAGPLVDPIAYIRLSLTIFDGVRTLLKPGGKLILTGQDLFHLENGISYMKSLGVGRSFDLGLKESKDPLCVTFRGKAISKSVVIDSKNASNGKYYSLLPVKLYSFTKEG